jgi:hypothetical protein
MWMAAAILVTAMLSACGPQGQGPLAAVSETQTMGPRTTGAPEKDIPERIRPITFRLKAGTLLERNLAARVQRDNAKLAKLLAEIREAVMEKKDFDARTWSEDMGDTYLKDPTLTLEDRTEFEGWDAVIPQLEKITRESTYFGVQSVHVELEYLPYDSPQYRAINEGREYPDLVDIIAHIKTILVHASDTGTVKMGGDLRHRLSCDPEF